MTDHNLMRSAMHPHDDAAFYKLLHSKAMEYLGQRDSSENEREFMCHERATALVHAARWAESIGMVFEWELSGEISNDGRPLWQCLAFVGLDCRGRFHGCYCGPDNDEGREYVLFEQALLAFEIMSLLCIAPLIDEGDIEVL